MLSDLVQRARFGDPDAIAFLINRQLQPKGITARVLSQSAGLEITLQRHTVPPRRPLVAYLQRSFTRLGSPAIQRVDIYGQQAGDIFPTWEVTLRFRTESSDSSADLFLSSSSSSSLVESASDDMTADDMTAGAIASHQDTDQNTQNTNGEVHQNLDADISYLSNASNDTLNDASNDDLDEDADVDLSLEKPEVRSRSAAESAMPGSASSGTARSRTRLETAPLSAWTQIRLWISWAVMTTLAFLLGGYLFGWNPLAGLLMTGLLVAIAQWIVVRPYLSRSGWWIAATYIGWLLGGIGLITGLAQWLILRRDYRRADWWIVACLGASAAGALTSAAIWRLLSALLPLYFGQTSARLEALIIAMAALANVIIASLITGRVLVWIFQRPLPSAQNSRQRVQRSSRRSGQRL